MASRLPDVTIFADAALCLTTGAAGWGCWMISRSRPSLTKGGPLSMTFPLGGACSTEAELFALANALHVAAKAGYLKEGASVMLQSDNTNALGFIRHDFQAEDRPMKDREDGVHVVRKDPRIVGRQTRGAARRALQLRIEMRTQALKAIGGMKKNLGLKLIVRHVRGHRSAAASEGDGRAWVNETCDRLAKAGKVVARRKLLETEDA